jgi:cysteine-rich repeat protein
MEGYEKSGAHMRLEALHTLAALLVAAPLVGVGCTGDMTSDHSALSGEGSGSAQDADCTLTQGYWKNHADAWPVDSLKLGTVTYSRLELVAILKTPVKGNGLVQLAHQLIAAKLNLAAGADDAAIAAVIDEADALIGSLVCPPQGEGKLTTHATSSLEAALGDFNEGHVGPGHCGDNDHGDDNDGDDNEGEGSGCGTTAVCGDGVTDDGEECDDGNLVNGDGCSSACACECPTH